MIDCTCVICGKSFQTFQSNIDRGQGKCCSYECAGRLRSGNNNVNYQGGKQEYMCGNCGREFFAHPSRRKQGRAKYCSRECTNEAHKVARLSVFCDVCGEEIELTFARYQGASTHYCSRRCYTQRKTKLESEKARSVESVCEECGKTYYASRYDRARGMGKFCSRKCYSKYQSSHPSHGSYEHVRGGKRADLNGIYFRSAWEANYARYLNWLQSKGEILRWEFEPDTYEFHKIKKGSRYYTPDFKVFAPDETYEYHEVKGYMNQKSKTKLARMKKYYPSIKVVLIDKAEYRHISNMVSAIIENWE